MQQARTIMETRVNGSGVAGAEVQIDGVKNLVITVPGNEDLSRPDPQRPDEHPAGADRRQWQPGDQLSGRLLARR